MKWSNPFKKKYKSKSRDGIDIGIANLYNYTDKESRQNTALYLLSYSQQNRKSVEERWELMNDYYNGDHKTALELQAYLASQNIPFAVACVQDPFTHVESQINPDIPTFEFAGRDDDIDSKRAKQREYAVQFVIDNNKVNDKNTRQERRLGKLGNSIWKVYWDASIAVPGTKIGGDIKVIDVPIEQIFPDPSALTMDDCEYINYVYPMHIRAATRMYKKELADAGIILTPTNSSTDINLFNSTTQESTNDTVEIFEHWYKNDDGNMAVCTLINEQEVKHVDNYWIRTGVQNKLYPFVKTCKIQDENEFWDRSELEPIIDLVDAADREMAYGLLNSAFNANDMIIVEEDALSDGSSLQNSPNGITMVKAGRSSGVRRLGGLNGVDSRSNSIQFLQSQMERAVGNFDTSMGIEPARVTTASGIAQINEKAEARKVIKKADRNTGFQNLYELIDWTCLEFYDEERMIYIGAEDKELNDKYSELASGRQGEFVVNMDKKLGPIVYKYSSDKMAIRDERGSLCFPKIDCTVIASDSLSKSKAFSVQAIQEIARTQITPQNVEFIKQYVDLLGLPSAKEIKESLDKSVGMMPGQEQGQVPGQPQQGVNIDEVISQLSPEELDAVQNDPELLQELAGGTQ